ncbi:SusC/RagA family TonB-linked outer membrane protein [Candidatus Kryptobacter tengchongensis]|uniref:TonB-linked outer membrane protein, SusC/RagA family n=1 Tax=Kryptobacter tengchongensis TaxID=1643429 RepID=A0A916LJD2_KRYT1|nr:SusC/RagA family TonB-linked outer membrane protein [Candidatus Kryptobacter tengchongensis]CUT00124.1 TonB-linked outer membrane protein, SusC/RagA family [Candidatus Kryptobacter tengchongensis]
MRKLILSLLLLLAVATFAFAQLGAIRGRVTDAQTGEALPGANVFLLNTVYGAASDAAGFYVIRNVVPGTYTLVARYVGYQEFRQSVTVTPGDTITVNVRLAPGLIQVSPIVVTAIGVEEERGKLGTSVSSVTGETILRTGYTNVISSIAVKAPGVFTVEAVGDPGASTRIVLRGPRSLQTANQPLIVVDGVPIWNSTFGASVGNVSTVSRNVDINPEDIESIEIMKGPAAAAIWGARAANGVIVIKTKSGSFSAAKKIRLSLKSRIHRSELLRPFPLQREFGQGQYGNFVFNSALSWGDRIADRPGGPDSLARPDYPYSRIVVKRSKDTYDHATELFRKPITWNSSLEISGGDEWGSFYLNAERLEEQGIILANSDFKRTSLRANVSRRFAENITARINAVYVKTSTNRVQQGSNISGLLLGAYRTPPDFNNQPYVVTYISQTGARFPNSHRSYRNGEGDPTRGVGYNNPFFTIYRNNTLFYTDRVFGSAEISYDPLKWLNIIYRIGADYYTDRRNQLWPYQDAAVPTGRVTRQVISQYQINTDLMFRFKYQLNKFLSGSFLIGTHLDHEQTDNTFIQGTRFILSDAPAYILNTLDYLPDEGKTIVRTAAFYGELGVDVYDQVYVRLSGRNESASTYGAKGKKTYFFPSGSVAWEFTKLPFFATQPIITFGKLRAAVGIAGVRPPAYVTKTYYVNASFGNGWGPVTNAIYYGGGAVQSSQLGNPEIKPELTREIEFGLDLRLLNDRLSISATRYTNKTTDAILNVAVPPSSGFSTRWANTAKIDNKGTELQVIAEWLRLGTFSWTTTVNWSQNKNTVVELAPGIESVGLAGFVDPSSRAVKGYAMGVLYGSRWERDATGKIVLDANGFPVPAATYGVLGDPNPDWRAGLINTLRFGRLTLNVVVDIAKGGKIWNGTKGALYYFGTHGDQTWWTTISAEEANTLKNYLGRTPNEMISLYPTRNTYKRNPDGSVSFRGYVTDFGGGRVIVDEYYFWSGPGSGFTGPSEQFMEDAGYVKLREISLTYNFPLRKFGLESIDLGVIMRNIKIWTKYTGIDPETNLTGPTNGQGLDYFNNPPMKSIIFSISINY